MEPQPWVPFILPSIPVLGYSHNSDVSSDIAASVFMYTRWIDCHLVTHSPGESRSRIPLGPLWTPGRWNTVSAWLGACSYIHPLVIDDEIPLAPSLADDVEELLVAADARNSDGGGCVPACSISRSPTRPAHIPPHETNPTVQVRLASSQTAFDRDRSRERKKEKGGEISSSIRDPGPDTGLKPRSCLGLANEVRGLTSSGGVVHSIPATHAPSYSVATARFIGSLLIISSYRDNSFTTGLVVCCSTRLPHDRLLMNAGLFGNPSNPALAHASLPPLYGRSAATPFHPP